MRDATIQRRLLSTRSATWAGLLLCALPLSATPVLLNTWTQDSFGGILTVAPTFQEGTTGVVVRYSNQLGENDEWHGGVLRLTINGGAGVDVAGMPFMMWNERTGTHEYWSGDPLSYRRERGFGYANDPLIGFSMILSGFGESDQLLFTMQALDNAATNDDDEDDADDPPAPPPPPPDPNVPESSTTLLIGLGMAALSLWGRRRLNVADGRR